MKKILLSLSLLVSPLLSHAATQIYIPSTSTFHNYTINVAAISGTTVTASGPIRIKNGTSSAPAISFASDVQTGFFRSGAGTTRYTAAGTPTVSFLSTGLEVTAGVITNSVGSVSAPSYSFLGDEDTGFFQNGVGAIRVAINGVEEFKFDSTGVQFISTSAVTQNAIGTALLPPISFTGDLDTGIFWGSANNFKATAGGATVATFSSTGTSILATTAGEPATTDVGGYTQQLQLAGTNFPTSAAWGDLTATPITITPGAWTIFAEITPGNNSATNITDWRVGVSSVNGNNTTNMSLGDNQYFIPISTGGSCATIIYPTFTATTTTYYLKYMATYTGSTPSARGKILAIRR